MKSSTCIRAFYTFAISALLIPAQTVRSQTIELLSLPAPGQLTSSQNYTLPGYGQVQVSWNLLSAVSQQQSALWSQAFTTLNNRTIPGSTSVVLPGAVRMLVISHPDGQKANRADGTVDITFLGPPPDLNRLRLLVDNLGVVGPDSATIPATQFQKTTITPSVAVTQLGSDNHSPSGTGSLTLSGGVIQNSQAAASLSEPPTNTGIGVFSFNNQLQSTLTLTISQTYNDQFAINLGYVKSTKPPVVDVAGPIGHINKPFPTLVPQPDPCCPPWSDHILKNSIAYSGTTISAPYSLRFQPPATLHPQMQAYINYLNTVDPSLTTINIDFSLYPAGNGATPGAIGTQLGTSTIRWTAGASAPSGSAGFFPPGVMSVNNWYIVQTHIYLGDGGEFFGENCTNKAMAVRVQVGQGLAGNQSGDTRSTANPLEYLSVTGLVGRAAPTGQDKAEPKNEMPKVEEPRKETPKVEEPKKEVPKVEEPKKEIPKVEEPRKEAPKVEEPTKETPKVEDPKKEIPKVETPKTEEPKNEKPKVEESKVEEPKGEEPKTEEPKREKQ